MTKDKYAFMHHKFPLFAPSSRNIICSLLMAKALCSSAIFMALIMKGDDWEEKVKGQNVEEGGQRLEASTGK